MVDKREKDLTTSAGASLSVVIATPSTAVHIVDNDLNAFTGQLMLGHASGSTPGAALMEVVVVDRIFRCQRPVITKSVFE